MISEKQKLNKANIPEEYDSYEIRLFPHQSYDVHTTCIGYEHYTVKDGIKTLQIRNSSHFLNLSVIDAVIKDISFHLNIMRYIANPKSHIDVYIADPLVYLTVVRFFRVQYITQERWFRYLRESLQSIKLPLNIHLGNKEELFDYYEDTRKTVCVTNSLMNTMGRIEEEFAEKFLKRQELKLNGLG